MAVVKVSTIWYVEDPKFLASSADSAQPDHDAAATLAAKLFPDRNVVDVGGAVLADVRGAGRESVFVGCFPGVTVLAGERFVRPRPSELPGELIDPLGYGRTYLVTLAPNRQWGAFALWEDGRLRRSFSATRVHILEDFGLPGAWERAFWAGKHPVRRASDELPDPLSLPFDPEEFADAANREWLGFTHRAADDAQRAYRLPLREFRLYPTGEAPTSESAMPEPRGTYAPAPGRIRRNGRALRSWWQRVNGAHL
ncbi:MAG: hypothetical protein ICV72_12775 [Aldersonia sp.]|nr:hypothetical protein [Aldersonia sp.]